MMTKEQQMAIIARGGNASANSDGMVDLNSSRRSNWYLWRDVYPAIEHLVNKQNLGLEELNPAELLCVYLLQDAKIMPTKED